MQTHNVSRIYCSSCRYVHLKSFQNRIAFLVGLHESQVDDQTLHEKLCKTKKIYTLMNDFPRVVSKRGLNIYDEDIDLKNP